DGPSNLCPLDAVGQPEGDSPPPEDSPRGAVVSPRVGSGEAHSILLLGDPVMRRLLLASLAGVAFLLAAASLAVAASMTVWVGRDIDNNRIIWTCSNVGGNAWKLKKNGTTVGDYEGVTSTAEFVELQLKGTKKYDRLRLYKDKLSLNQKGSRTEWIPIA